MRAARDNGSLVMAGALADPAYGTMFDFKGYSPTVAEDLTPERSVREEWADHRWYVRAWTVVIG